MGSPAEAFTQMITATHRWQGKNITDQFVDHNALFRLMKERGHIKTEADGGDPITYPIAYAPNRTLMNYTDFERLDLGQSDFLTNVSYTWRQKAVHIVASGRELRINRGESMLIKLAKAKRENLISTISNHMASELYQDGSVSGSFGGLASIITTDGQGLVGGIDGNVYSWWRNKVENEPAATGPTSWSDPDNGPRNIQRSIDRLRISCTIGADKPDIYVLTNDLYLQYLQSFQARQRFTSAGKATEGFENLVTPDGAIVLHDLNVSGGFTGEMGYALNTKYLYLLEHPDARWRPEPERKPVDQDGVVIPHYWMGQLICNSRRHQGILVAA